MKKLINSLILASLAEIDKVKLRAYAKDDFARAHKFAMLHLLWEDLRTLINHNKSFWSPDMLFKLLIYPMFVDAIQSYNGCKTILAPSKKNPQPKEVIRHAKKMLALHRKEIENCRKIAEYLIEQFPEYYFKIPKLPKY
jgi:hypothetical protein